jgi:glyoxylase-like metal-dependent hydrolase (beta-lactamase superfamily II)
VILASSTIVLALAVAAAVPRAANAQPVETTRAISNIRGDLYRVQDGPDATVFLVTSDGIILGDPLNTSLTTWLKDELARRFPGRPVKYVVQTRHDFERASGAWVFKSTAEIVSQETFDRERLAASFHLPPALAILDQSRDGRLESSEIGGSDRESLLKSLDRNHDGVVTPSELYSDVSSTQSVYGFRRTIVLGGKTVEVVHPGPLHAPDETVLFFPEERVLFAAETVSSLPASLGPDARALLAWLRTVDSLTADTLITGSGAVQPKSELTGIHQYLEVLVAAVSIGLRGGEAVSQIDAGVSANLRSQVSGSTYHSTHVAELYESLRLMTIDIYGAAIAEYATGGAYCMPLVGATAPANCRDLGGRSTFGTSGFAFNRGRFGGAVEMSVSHRTTDWTESGIFSYGLSLARHESRRDAEVAFLVRYATRVQRSVATLVAGMSVTRATTAMTDHFIEPLPVGYSAQPTTFQFTDVIPGLIGGVDFSMPLGSRLRLFAPVRVSHQSPPDSRAVFGPPHWYMRAGAGLQVNLTRRVQ